MSGHSKWANIKRQKQANDLVRGNVFSKFSRVITLAVVEGGGITDPNHNVRLRLAIEKARQSNMPKYTIQRAIEKGVGPDRSQLKEITYEAFGPAGVGLMILVTTDNQNRTLAETRNILERYEAKMANQGSVSYLFRKCGVVVFDRKKVDEDSVIRFSEALQAFDIDEDDAHFSVYIPFENLGRIKDHTQGLTYETAEIDYKPISLIPVLDEQTSKRIISLVNVLEAHEEIQKVFTNADIPEQYLTNTS